MLFILQERFSAGSNNLYVFATAISMPLFYLLLTFCTSFILTIELISFPYKPIKLKHDDPIYYYIIIIIIVIVIIIIIIIIIIYQDIPYSKTIKAKENI